MALTDDVSSGIPVPTDEQLGPEMVSELRKHPPLNIDRYLALVPECFQPWQDMVGGLYATELDPKLREIAICRVGSVAGATYELFQHTVLAKQRGVSEMELEAILSDEPVTTLGEDANLICRVVDELADGTPLSDATFAAFSARYDARSAMTWLILIGHYACVVRVLNGARVPIEQVSPVAGREGPA